MPLIGSDFVIDYAPREVKCSECGAYMKKGEPSMVSRRNGRVRKRICTREDCRQAFDDRYWQERARERAMDGGR